MNKKIPLAPATPRELEAARLAGLCVQPSLTMADLQGAIKEGLMAVSYTHLDVYKRQPSNLS